MDDKQRIRGNRYRRKNGWFTEKLKDYYKSNPHKLREHRDNDYQKNKSKRIEDAVRRSKERNEITKQTATLSRSAWCVIDDEFLMTSSLSLVEIATMLGRTMEACKTRRYKLRKSNRAIS